MADVCHIDFETRSVLDLTRVGVHVYAVHPSTGIWCMAWAFGDEEPELWWPVMAPPSRLLGHVRSGGKLKAWNAQFERIMWRCVLTPQYGFPEPRLEQYICTMCEAYAMSFPGKLEWSAAALSTPEQKDAAGYRLMMQMCRPRRIEPDGTIVWWDDAEKKRALGEYCKQDVRAERSIGKQLLPIPTDEQELYWLDQRVNDRGVRIDVELCQQAKKIVAVATEKLDAELRDITDGDVSAVSNVQQLVAWLKRQGVDTDSVAKNAIEELLVRDDLPPTAARALEIRKQGAKTSTAKIDAMLTRRNSDGRMRGNLQYHGAGTGRWAARGAQLQNLPRPELIKDDDPVVLEAKWRTAIEALQGADPVLIEMLYGPPLTVVADTIRGMIVAEDGSTFTVADLAGIEGRGTAWIAGEAWKLDAYRRFDAGQGPDSYLVAAAGIYGCAVADAKPHRQVGKVAELALGYQGGPRAFAKMAKDYRVKLEPLFAGLWERADADRRGRVEQAWHDRGKATGIEPKAWAAAEIIKLAWREKHPRIVAGWDGLEEAAVKAVMAPGTICQFGYVKYLVNGSFLWCLLPSGRTICYPFPKLVDREMKYGRLKDLPAIRYMATNQFTKKWERKAFYGGLAMENVVQAISRDIMVGGMRRVEALRYWIVLTIHDEIVSEHQIGHGSVDEFIAAMTAGEAWSQGFPIAAAGWRGPRYRKG